MDVSIVVPVFNKADLTRVCLNALKKTIPSSLACETIVVDNNSSDDTQHVLAQFPWITVVSNKQNVGYAAANNQGAKAASGKMLVLLNNDTEPQSGWLEALLQAAASPEVGIVGARLLFADRTIQHSGVVVSRDRFGPYHFTPYHYLWSSPGTTQGAMQRREFQIVTGACLMTPRALYLELGGLDELYWNGYEDVDYCFKVLRVGKRIVYEPGSEMFHYESQSGPLRFSRVAYNSRILATRWAKFPKIDHNQKYLSVGNIRRTARYANKFSTSSMMAPSTTVVFHGPQVEDVSRLIEQVARCVAPIEKVVWTLPSPAPSFGRVPVVHAVTDPIATVRDEMEVRGDRFLAVIDSRAILGPGWLEALIEELEFGSDVAAATVASDDSQGEEYVPLTADARCTLLALRYFPQHETLRGFSTLGGSIADLLLRMLPYEYGTRVAAGVTIGHLFPQEDAKFAQAYAGPLIDFLRDDVAALERILAERSRRNVADIKASIVMLSWNALQFTQIAVESIRKHTRMPHEVIIVDNGSGPETTEWLRTQENIKVIFNPSNRGFAAGCNQGIAAATGDYIVLLNNDVVVTDGWLESLVDAVERDPAAGVSAARSNEIAGDQKLLDLNYHSIEEMHAVAASRARTWKRAGYFTDRAIGFCLCIDRTVIEQVGGIDENYGTGNFEDDDFCMRIRAAGYRIYVCNDVFIHHFGSKSFQANRVDYAETMNRNWAKFSSKWRYPPEFPVNGYDPAHAIRKGFNHAKHFVPIKGFATPAAATAATDAHTEISFQLVIAGVVSNEGDWTSIGGVVRRCLSVFNAQDSVAIAVMCAGTVDADLIGARIEKIMGKLGIDPARSIEVFVSDDSVGTTWFEQFVAAQRFRMGPASPWLDGVPALEARSPSDLRRLYTKIPQRQSVQ